MAAPEEATSPTSKPFAEMARSERRALLAADPAAYEREMLAEALAHQAEFLRSGKVTANGGDPADPRTMPRRITKFGGRKK